MSRFAFSNSYIYLSITVNKKTHTQAEGNLVFLSFQTLIFQKIIEHPRTKYRFKLNTYMYNTGP